MSQPQPAIEAEADEALDELDGAEPTADDPFDGSDEIDLDLADTDVGEDVTEGDEEHDDPFDSVDEGSGEFDDVSREFEESFGPDEEDLDELTEGEEGELAEIINQGASQLAVVGLQDEFEVNGETRTKADLRNEFEEVFETFQLGRYSEECATEYLWDPDEDIEPIWGFAASMLLCTAMVLWMRPDGGELTAHVGQKLPGGRS